MSTQDHLFVETPQPNLSGEMKFVNRPRLAAVVEASAEVLGIGRSRWWDGRCSDDASRAVAAYLCRRVLGYSGREVASALGYRDGGSVTRAIAGVEGKDHLRRAAKRREAEVRPGLFGA